MSRSVVASVPGKLILMGEHAAVYGSPALVAAVGLRVRVEAAEAARPGVSVELPDLGLADRFGWDELAAYAAGARAAWERYAAAPSVEGLEALGGADRAHVVKVALGELAGHVAGRVPGAELRVASELPPGSGFGSSAAVAVGVIAALSDLAGEAPAADDAGSLERVDALALEVERRQHGFPSGVDHATVLRGGVLHARGGDAGLEVTPLEPRPGVLERFRVLHTGVPAESTGAVVAAVRRRRDREPAALGTVLDSMRELVAAFRLRLDATRPRPAAGAGIGDLVRAYEACLEELGVVPAPVRETVRRLERGGWAAKISGAGALGGGAAGSLLAYHPDPERPLPEWLPAGFAVHRVALGVPGLALEERS